MPDAPSPDTAFGILSGTVLVFSLLSAFFLTMARHVFARVVRDFDSLEPTPLLRKIRDAGEIPHLHEGITFGRSAGIAVAFLILFRDTAPLFLPVEPAPLRAVVQVCLLFPLVYAFTVLVPGIVVAARPTSL